MEITECRDQERWDGLTASRDRAQFLESWAWADLEASEGRKVYRLALEKEEADGPAAVFILIRHPLLAGWNYFYTPRGPIFSDLQNNLESWNAICRKVKELAADDRAVFWRFEAIFPWPQELAAGLVKTKPVQPKNTLILDLRDPASDILKKMHPKTRYNIKVAEKKGVEIKISERPGEKEFEAFWNLMRETARRDKFLSHSRDHYRNIVNSNLNAKLFLAFVGDRAIAANLVLDFGDTSTYLHGASANEFRNLMPAYLLQWEAIKKSQAAGRRYYDFWGINRTPRDADYRKEWEGITRFKRGFGGQEISFLGAYELPIDKTYYELYRVYKGLKSNF